ncbi:MAG: class I SAM-dependent methyltransferase [bacterium]|nr:class I SAM-dependent methyltransferase [bacterium]
MTSATVSGVQVWESLWRGAPDSTGDLARIRREERSQRWAYVLRTLISTFGGIEGLRVVELGSGRGDLSALLAMRGARVTLVDYSDSALWQARQRFDALKLDAEFVRGDLLGDLGALAGRFDVSCSLGVIEHFRGRRRRQTLAAHHRVLGPRGVAIVSVPHAWGLSYRLWKLYLELRGWWPYGLEIPYSKGELRLLAGMVGFAETELHCAGLWQSIGDHWCRTALGTAPDWVERSSRLDSAIGATLTLAAWNGRRGPR